MLVFFLDLVEKNSVFGAQLALNIREDGRQLFGYVKSIHF